MNKFCFKINSIFFGFYLVDEKGHEAKKEAYKEAAEERGVIGQIGDTVSNAYNYVAEKVHGSYIPKKFFFCINIFIFRSNKWSILRSQ